MTAPASSIGTSLITFSVSSISATTPQMQIFPGPHRTR